jgi:GNAT superfamily N-acetyltransferase
MDSTPLNTLQVRLAEPKDLDAIMAIEESAWPSGNGMRAERFKFASRIECEFVTVVCNAQGEVLGVASAFRPNLVCPGKLDELLTGCPSRIFDQQPVERWQSIAREFGLSRNWHEATADGTLRNGAEHDPRGQVLYAVGLAIRPESTGRGVAHFLLQSLLAEAAKSGVRYFVAYARLPMFYRFPHVDVDSYLRMTRTDAQGVRPLDPQHRFYWSIGAQPMQCVDGRFRYVGIPESMRDDPESRGYGLLTITPMGATPFPLNRLS